MQGNININIKCSHLKKKKQLLFPCEVANADKVISDWKYQQFYSQIITLPQVLHQELKCNSTCSVLIQGGVGLDVHTSCEHSTTAKCCHSGTATQEIWKRWVQLKWTVKWALQKAVSASEVFVFRTCLNIQHTVHYCQSPGTNYCLACICLYMFTLYITEVEKKICSKNFVLGLQLKTQSSNIFPILQFCCCSSQDFLNTWDCITFLPLY